MVSDSIALTQSRRARALRQVSSRPGKPESSAVAAAVAAAVVVAVAAPAVLGGVVELVDPVVAEASSVVALDMLGACYQTRPGPAGTLTRSDRPSSRCCGCAGNISDGAETGFRDMSAALAEDDVDVDAQLPGRSC